MTTYAYIEENWEKIDLEGLDGETIVKPKIQCELCGEGISRDWAQKTGQCGGCTRGLNQVGNRLNRIYTVGVYISESNDHELTNQLGPPKDGSYAEKKARILQWGIENFDELDEVDLIVPPPSGKDSDDNHMADAGERLSEYVDTPFRDIARGDYPPQTDTDSAEERVKNVSGEVEVAADLSDINRILIVDDIVTTCSTMSDTARALLEAGTNQVVGLGATRSMDFEYLEKANLMEEI